ncbi:MAG: hypothetical protein KGH98_04095 [Candidatus Micrarchaeota archaeon]|nr:hypothetical protein [Candidatus Micrarchaeota archaeon]
MSGPNAKRIEQGKKVVLSSPVVDLLRLGLDVPSIRDTLLDTLKAIELSHARIQAASTANYFVNAMDVHGYTYTRASGDLEIKPETERLPDHFTRMVSIFISPREGIYDDAKMYGFISDLQIKLAYEYRLQYSSSMASPVNVIRRGSQALYQTLSISVEEQQDGTNKAGPKIADTAITIFILPDEALAKYAAANTDLYGYADSSALEFSKIAGISPRVITN